MTPRPVDSSGEPAAADIARTDAPDPRPANNGALGGLLATHCQTAGAEGGAVLVVAANSQVHIAALWPQPDPAGSDEPPDWLSTALQEAPAAAQTTHNQRAEGDTATQIPLHDPGAMYGEPPSRTLVLTPLASSRSESPTRTLLAMAMPSEGDRSLLAEAASSPAEALAPAITLTATINEHERYLAAAMAVCNELASLAQCERVSLGLLAGHYVQLSAMSHTEKFSRKMRMVQTIEAAMEECLDQDIEIAVPAPPESQYVYRSTIELCESGTPRLAALCVPLRRDGKCVGAICLERSGDRPFEPAEIESLRLACDLLTPRLLDLRRRDRWIGAKVASGVRSGAAAVVGPRHTWAKLLLLLVAAGAVYASLADGEYRIDAPLEFQAARRQAAVAPYDGEVESVEVDPGDKVKSGQILATLQTLPLQRKLDQARAGLFEHLKQADAARSDKKWAEAQMAAAQARQYQEQISLLTEQIEQATIRARIDGTVIRGDLRQFVGSSVEKGRVLFEVAPLAELRAEILVPSDQIADLREAMQAGEVRVTLSAEAYPDRPIEAVIERVLPLAEKVDGEVVFRTRVRLIDADGADSPAVAANRQWIRPGMTGAAHIPLGRRRLAWIWTRRIVNKVRLWLWL